LKKSIDPGGTLRRNLLMLSPPMPLGLSKIKSVQHICNDPNQTLFSLGLNTALQYLQQKGIEASMTKAEELKIGSVIFPAFDPNTGGYRGADAGGYQILLRYRSANNAVKQVSLIDLLNDRATGDLIRDRIVMMGYTTPLAKDDFYTPYSGGKGDQQKMPGVVVHAQAASQILAAVLDGRKLIWTWPFGIELAWIFSCSVLGGILGWYLRHPLWFSLASLAIAGSIYAISLFVFLQGGWIPLVPAITAFLASAIGIVLFDRFNNSEYGQAVYTKVKTLLHLEVEIDEEKLQKQVAEITETDYFKDLQSSVKDLRTHQTAGEILPGAISPVDHLDRLNKPSPDIVTTSSSQFSSSNDYEEDYFSQIKHESQKLKPSSSPVVPQDLSSHSPNLQPLSFSESETNSEVTDDDFDFLQQIKDEAKGLKDDQQDDH
jgi:adenylate cyclase